MSSPSSPLLCGQRIDVESAPRVALFNAMAGRVGAYLVQRAQAHGLIVRNLMDTVAFSPPMIITEEQIAAMLERCGKALDETEASVARAGSEIILVDS